MDSREELLGADIRSIFFKYLLPSVGGMMGNSLYILGDTIMVGRALGAVGLAAVNISIPMLKLANSIGLIFGVGGATALAVSRGRGDYERGNEIFNLSLFFGLIFGLLLTIINTLFIDRIVWGLGATDFSFEMTRTYLLLVMSTTIPTVISIALSMFVRNDGSPRLVMLASLSACFFNLVMDYILIFPLNMGIFGGALATALSPLVSVAILSLHFFRGRNELSFQKIDFNLALLKRIVQNGFPSAIIEFTAGIVVLMFNVVILRLTGDLGVSAYSIIANLSLVFNAIFNGMGQAIQPIVSINYGAGEMDRVYRATRLGSITAFLAGLVFFFLGLVFPERLASIFTSDRGELLAITSNGIRLYFSAFILMGVNIVITSYIQSMENYRVSTIISLLRGSIFVVGVLMILPRFLGIDGVWLTIITVEVITLIFSYQVFPDYRQALAYILRGK